MKICYEDYRKAVRVFRVHMNRFVSVYNKYLKYMEIVSEQGLIAGQTAEGFRGVLTQLKKIVEIPKGLPKRMENLVELYLEELHNAQVVDGVSILYDKNYSGVRDYSNIFNELSDAVEKADYDKGFARIRDLVEDSLGMLISKCLNEYDLSTTKNIRKTQENLLHYKDVTAKRLRSIESNIKQIEKNYEKCFMQINDTVSNIVDYLREIDQYFSDYNLYGKHLSSDIILKLSGLYQEMTENYAALMRYDVVSDEEVNAFINSIHSEAFNDPHVATFTNGMNELCNNADGIDYARLLIYNFFDISEKSISGQDYELLCKKTELLEIMNTVGDSYNFDESEEKEYLDYYQKILKLVKKYGDNWKKHYTGDRRLKKYRDTAKFFENIGNYSKALGEVEEGAEILTQLFTDYSRNLQFLDSVEKNYAAEGKMKEAFQDIRALYEKNMSESLLNIKVEKLAEDSVDALYSLPIGKMVGNVKAAIGLVGAITGDGTRSQAQIQLHVYGSDMMGMASEAFKNAVTKLKSVDTTDPDYGGYVEDVKNSYIVYRETMVNLFNKMALASSGDEKNYYAYCANTVSSLRLSDYGTKRLMSMDEFLKQT